MGVLATERWPDTGPTTAGLQRKRLIEAFAECADGLAEGETSVKRGYLNMLHARDAIRARGEAIAAAADPAGAEARRRLRNH